MNIIGNNGLGLTLGVNGETIHHVKTLFCRFTYIYTQSVKTFISTGNTRATVEMPSPMAAKCLCKLGVMSA